MRYLIIAIIILCGCRPTDDNHPMNEEISVGIFPPNSLVISKLYSSGVDPLTGVPFPAKWAGYLHIAGQVQYDEAPGVLSYYWTTNLPSPLKVVCEQHGIYTDLTVYTFGDNPQLSSYVGSATLRVWTLNGDVDTSATTTFEVVVSSPQ